MIQFRVNSGQWSICLLSPAIAQTIGVNKSVSFARWQQGAGFVVPRTTTCCLDISVFLIFVLFLLVFVSYCCKWF